MMSTMFAGVFAFLLALAAAQDAFSNIETFPIGGQDTLGNNQTLPTGGQLTKGPYNLDVQVDGTLSDQFQLY
jgi:hypothetical protein